MADRRLDFPLAIRIPDAAGQCDGAVMREHVAVERVQRGVVEVRRQHALPQIVEDDDLDRPAQPPKRLLVQLGPAPGARLKGQQPDALAAVAQGEDKEPRAPVLARDRMSDHRAVAVIDLAFLPGGRHDHRMRLGGPLTPERDDEAPDARVLGREAVIIDQIAPDRHGVAAAGEGRLDELARYGAHALAVGARPGGGGVFSGVESPGGRAPGSVDTSMAGFAAGWPHRPGGRTASPAALR
jgi:hypothetical protein